MTWSRMVLAAAIIALPTVADAAELTPPPIHKTHAGKVRHVRIARVAPAHFGYYWGQWGWRRGGTARSWYGSTFAFLEPRWW